MRALLLVLLAGASLAASSAQAAKAPGPLALIKRGLERSVERGELTASEAAGYRRIARRVVAEVGEVPPLRAVNLTGALADVAAQWRSYTKPRALTLFSMLAVNADELGSRRLPPAGTDVHGPDGVVYRLVTGHGFAFHPLANFAELNTLALRGDEEGTERLASALLVRAVPRDRALVWEYPFPFGNGRPPWTSGMAQAVAAQALARAGDLLSETVFLEAADAAFWSIPGRLVRQLPAGPWIELYSFDRLAVLNAQLQAVLSLADFAEITGSPSASVLAGRLQTAAQELLPSFDTGYWSLYALDGSESRLAYHDYVIDLLRRLAVRTGDRRWRETALRFEEYMQQPPLLRPDDRGSTIYPVPEDGYLDGAPIRFWLSKLSQVTLRVGRSVQTVTLGRGRHELVWAPGGATPGLYRPRLVAVDESGNRSRATLGPVQVRHDLRPPRVSVRVKAPTIVVWHAVDDGTPWLELTVKLLGQGQRRELDLGRRSLVGWARLRLPPGRWHATLVAANSAGKRAAIPLGYLPR